MGADKCTLRYLLNRPSFLQSASAVNTHTFWGEQALVATEGMCVLYYEI